MRMAVPIKISRFSGNVDESKIVEWKFAEGDRVEKGDVILMVDTEEVSMEIEADASGLLHILAKEDGRLAVGTTVGMLADASFYILAILLADHGLHSITTTR